MKRADWRRCRAWASLAILALAGCGGLFGPVGPPRDPLFLSRQPIEGRPSRGDAVALAFVEPSPPPVPVEIANRPAFAQRRATPIPDRVLLSTDAETKTTPNPPRTPRTAPGVLTNRPIQRDPAPPESKQP